MPGSDARQRGPGHIGAPAVTDEKQLPRREAGFLQKALEQSAAALLHTVSTGDKAAVKAGIAAAAQHRVDLRLRQVHIGDIVELFPLLFKCLHRIQHGPVCRTGGQLCSILATTNVVLPKERHYFIETNYTQYIHAHHKQDLEVTRAIIARKCPEYLPAYDLYMSKTHGHHFNMFVMKKELLQHYCTWLFDILFELERELDMTGYTVNDRRVFGFVSERLLDAWLTTNNISFEELSIVYMEHQNWLRKGTAFLKRKFFPKKDA